MILVSLAIAAAAATSIYDDPKNLKVLPKDIAPQELRRTMRGFSFDLGVNCESCHVGEKGAPIETFDFAADDKPMKASATLMIRMVADINGRQLARLDREASERIEVRCVTCHRGLPSPLSIGEALDEAYRKGGAGVAIEKYRKLKSEFFGSGSFDFTEQPRLDYARQLAARLDPRGAIAFLTELHDEHGASFMTDLTLAEMHVAAGEPDQALAALKKALSSAPAEARAFIQGRIDALDSIE